MVYVFNEEFISQSAAFSEADWHPVASVETTTEPVSGWILLLIHTDHPKTTKMVFRYFAQCPLFKNFKNRKRGPLFPLWVVHNSATAK
jgi:hypothetical protein